MIDPSRRLRRAINTSDSLLLRRILDSHPSLLHNPDFSPEGLSNTSLHLAASLGHISIVRDLLSLNHDTPQSISLNEEHETPLHLAAANGHSEIVHLLSSTFPQSIMRKDNRGRDALMLASTAGHDTCVQLLLTFAPGGPEALLQSADHDGNTALHFASSNGHLLVLRTLLAAGADSEKMNVWSWTALNYSATVQAEVYLKGLVGEVERRKQIKKEVESQGKGGRVRMVSMGDEEA